MEDRSMDDVLDELQAALDKIAELKAERDKWRDLWHLINDNPVQHLTGVAKQGADLVKFDDEALDWITNGEIGSQGKGKVEVLFVNKAKYDKLVAERYRLEGELARAEYELWRRDQATPVNGVELLLGC